MTLPATSTGVETNISHATISHYSTPMSSEETASEFIEENYDAFLHYYYTAPCPDYPKGRSSFWKTIMREEHFKDFLEFIKTTQSTSP